MLLEIIQKDNVLTWLLIIIGVLWFLVFLRNLWTNNKTATDYEQYYDHILTGDEHKVKGKFEE